MCPHTSKKTAICVLILVYILQGCSLGEARRLLWIKQVDATNDLLAQITLGAPQSTLARAPQSTLDAPQVCVCACACVCVCVCVFACMCV
jgi:hypothetical protein